MILGTYHLSGNDEDITSAKRQAEVKEIVSMMKKFRPTKIVVEVPFDKSEDLNNRYQQFLKGEYQLGKLEIDQIGFRLAKELSHQKLYPIDWRNKFDLNSVFAYANQNGQGKIIQGGLMKLNAQEAKLKQMVKTTSLVKILRFLNSDETIKTVDRLMLDTLVHIYLR